MRKIALAALFWSVVWGGSFGPAAAEEPGPVAVVLAGKIREVTGGPGDKPRALLVTPAGEQVSLQGRTPADTDELIRLSGMEVSVEAIRGDPSVAAPAALVTRYQIVDAGDGVRPRVGLIAVTEIDGERRLLFVDDEGEADVLPAGFARKMGRHVGSRAWMIGRRSKEGFKIARFGLLRPKEGPRESK